VSRSTLRLGEQVVLVAEGGTPDVEYALFGPGDIQLQATEPGTIREMGYCTVAAEARARLHELHVSAELAEDAAATAGTWAAKHARGAAVRCIASDLGASELFEGGTFDTKSGRYAGTWIDLPALASDVALPEASAAMQALHLAALLEESPDDTPLVLATAEVTALRRPGERTYKRVSLGSVGAVVQALRDLRPSSERGRSDQGPGRQEILERLRARSLVSQSARARFAVIDAALSAMHAPTAGPLADSELWNIELKLSEGDAASASTELDALEQRRGRLPATAYLRARAALIARSEEPRAVAERVSALSTSMPSFHELELLAAEAWAAAGDARRATAFARDVLENAMAPDSVRIRAHEVVAAAGSSPFRMELPRAVQPATEVTRAAAGPPIAAKPSTQRVGKVRMPSRTDVGALPPPYRVESLGAQRLSVPPPREIDVEVVEMLSLPPGAEGEPPPAASEHPRSPKEARVACTFLARELGRDLRQRYGVEVRSDLEGLEAAQRYLRESAIEAQTHGIEEREVLRNGAFLSELAARRLGGRWTDIDPHDPRRWAMLIPSAARPEEAIRIWPFARTARFVAMGHKERDLVSYYLELEASSR
jgi:hypothetical protein